MAHRILILGASYGSLLAMKGVMAGHDATLVCAPPPLTSSIARAASCACASRAKRRSRDPLEGSAGRLDACRPQDVDLSRYDLVVLAMQEPQYAEHTLRALMARIGIAGLPCLSLMNMPPLAYLKRCPASKPPSRGRLHQCKRLGRFQPGAVSCARLIRKPSARRANRPTCCR